jgi:cytochrome c oxidase subunit 5b
LDDLLPPGAPVGTIATDLNQSVGLERYEVLGKMQGIDVWDMKPLDSSRKGIMRSPLLKQTAHDESGTMEDPIVVKSIGLERYVGCSGGDTHTVNWMTISRSKPIERCIQCGNVIKMDYVGPDDPHRKLYHCCRQI